MTHEVFVERISKRTDIRLLRGQTYQKYRGVLKFKCNRKHTFNSTPQMILIGCGCNKCKRLNTIKRNKNRKLTVNQFLKQLKNRNKQMPEREVFLADKTKFKSRSIKTGFICKKEHTWVAYPGNILQGRGCPCCKKRPYSRKALEWLRSQRITIQHAENGGEFKIPGTNYFVDGYDKKSNTIYEFYGDAYHGNPHKFLPNEKCHPYDKQLTAGLLYKRTREKEKIIKQKGFNLIVIWESDWDNK